MGEIENRSCLLLLDYCSVVLALLHGHACASFYIDWMLYVIILLSMILFITLIG